MTTVSAKAGLLSTLLALAAMPAHAAGLFSLSASGTISSNSSGDATIPIGTPWTFEIIYDTEAPDGSADPTFGQFGNTASPPALTFFHYQAGSYEVTIEDPADFGPVSNILITFTAIHAIDINVHASDLFPELGGGGVSFHADFNDFSSLSIFASDGLPTNTELAAESFDVNTVSLLPPSGEVSGSILTSLTVTPVPEPSRAVLGVVGVLVLLVARKHRGA
jgi:hypothetical protein